MQCIHTDISDIRPTCLNYKLVVDIGGVCYKTITVVRCYDIFEIDIRDSDYSSLVSRLIIPFEKASLICNIYGATFGMFDNLWEDMFFNESADVCMVYIKLNAPQLYSDLEMIWNEERRATPHLGTRIV